MAENIESISVIRKFLIWTILLTWICWVPAGFLSIDKFSVLINILHYLGGAAPMIMTLFMLFWFGSGEERRGYWQRILDFKRIRLNWMLIILLTIPLLTAISVVIDRFFGGVGMEMGAVSGFIHSPLAIFPFVVFTLLFGPLPEEMAWRGYALDKLLIKFNVLIASIILGLYWILWHLPLFLIDGSYQYSLGIGTLQFWLFVLDKIPLVIIMTWIYNKTQHSTVSAVLFHFSVNFTGEMIQISQRAEIIYIGLIWILAMLVVLHWKLAGIIPEQEHIL